MEDSYCLSCRVPEEDKEIALGIFYRFGMQGCEEEIAEEEILFKCYFGDEEKAGEAKSRIAEMLPDTLVNVNRVEQQDWNAAWRESMEPVLLAEKVWVSPKWLKPPMQKSDYWIKIEPKMAFGTGHHETTRLSAQALLAIDISGQSNPALLDIGTGSGILCFIGDYGGYATCIGVEIDPDCAGNLAENLRDNLQDGSISFTIGTVSSIKHEPLFDTIVMNMLRNHSEPLLTSCRNLLKPDGKLIWSGILCDEKESVAAHADTNGWNLLDETTENEWWCGVFGKQ